MNQKFSDVQARFSKSRGTKDQIANILCIILQYTYHDGSAFLFTILLPTIPLNTDSYSNIRTVYGPFYLPNCYDSYYNSHELSRKGGKDGREGEDEDREGKKEQKKK